MNAIDIQRLLMEYREPFILLGSFLFGETAIISAAYLCATLGWSPIEVFVFALIGTMTSDLMWFSIGRKFSETRLGQKALAPADRLLGGFLDNLTERPGTSLLLYKFFYGLRIFTIAYLGSKKTPTGSFVFYNSIGAAAWLVVMIFVGWAAGVGLMNLAPFLGAARGALLLALAAIIGGRFARKWISKTTGA